MQHSKRMKVIGTLVVSIAIGIVFSWIRASETDNLPLQDSTQTIHKKEVSVFQIHAQDRVAYTISASGTVRPKPYTRVFSLVSGTVVSMTPVGTTAIQGQPLYQLTDTGIESSYMHALRGFTQTQAITEERINQSRLGLEAARARLLLAEESYALAEQQAAQALASAQDSGEIAYATAHADLQQVLTSLSEGMLAEHIYRYRAIATTQTALLTQVSDQFTKTVDAYGSLPVISGETQLQYNLTQMHKTLLAAKTLVDTTSYLLQNAIPGDQLNFLTSAELAITQTMSMHDQARMNQGIAAVLSQLHGLDAVVIGNTLALAQARNQKNLASIDVDNAQTLLASAQKGADLERTGAQAQLDAASYAYSNLTLLAPFTGSILSHFVDVGDQVRAGSEILELGNMRTVEISIEVAASFLRDLQVGTPARMNGALIGEVSELSPSASVTSGKARVVVVSQSAQNALAVGSVARVELMVAREGIDLIAIPLKAVTMEETGKSVLVAVLGKAVKRSVVLGDVLGDVVMVTEGLAQGDMLILRDGVFVSEGDVIEMKE